MNSQAWLAHYFPEADETLDAHGDVEPLKTRLRQCARDLQDAQSKLDAIKKDADMQPLVHYVRYDDFKAIESRLSESANRAEQWAAKLTAKDTEIARLTEIVDDATIRLDDRQKRLDALESKLTAGGNLYAIECDRANELQRRLEQCEHDAARALELRDAERNARIVAENRLGEALKTIEAQSAAYETRNNQLNEMHRRCQLAEGAVQEKIELCKTQGLSLSKRLSLAGYAMEQERRTAAENCCATMYQALGSLSDDFGIFHHPLIQDAMQALSECDAPTELLPWPAKTPEVWRAEAAEQEALDKRFPDSASGVERREIKQ